MHRRQPVPRATAPLGRCAATSRAPDASGAGNRPAVPLTYRVELQLILAPAPQRLVQLYQVHVLRQARALAAFACWNRPEAIVAGSTPATALETAGRSAASRVGGAPEVTKPPRHR